MDNMNIIKMCKVIKKWQTEKCVESVNICFIFLVSRSHFGVPVTPDNHYYCKYEVFVLFDQSFLSFSYFSSSKYSF